ncbi:MAG: high-affinity branched-chain amino acid ABC transporter permease LivM [Gammaproteobacteria bacterium]|nr:MAG: high-affinity branched-chain amino acid ABC transporter permease LivM [Gammaproteobacteria bacterium]
MKQNFQNAIIATVLSFVLLSLTIGGLIQVEGIETTVVARPWYVVIGCTIVFIIQLFRDQLVFVFKGFGNVLKTLVRAEQIAEHAIQLKGSDRFNPLFYLTVLICLSVYPFIVSDKLWIGMFIDIYIYILLALGLNIVVGYAGLLNLGYIAFYAVGAYTYGILNHFYDFSFWLALPLSGMTAALAGIILGFPVLRLRGDYLAIVTLGFGQVLVILLRNLGSITGGPDGIGSIDRPTMFGIEFSRRAKEGGVPFHEFFGLEYNSIIKDFFFYFLALALVIFTIYVISRLVKMPIGRSWEALREDETACKSLGINSTSVKLSAFAISSFFAGLAGCFFAAKQRHISPESFEFIESVIVLAIVVMGGMGSTIGIILAAIFVAVLKDYSQDLQEYRMLIFSLILIVMMIWRPRGLFPATRPFIKLQNRQKSQECGC